jgi:transposase
MNAREERGLVIAALCKLRPEGNGQWIVPSQSGPDRTYRVDLSSQKCSCPDYQERGEKCKHIYAAEFTVRREIDADGIVTETKTITFTEKKTYKQDWPAYNAAQSVEKDRFQELLFDLTRGIPETDRTGEERQGVGRKPHTYRDSIFACVFKIYCGMSARRASSDLREAHRRGHMSREVPGKKVCAMMENAEMTPILKYLIAESARPLRAVETQFAIDSSGFGTSNFERWYDQKYGVTRTRCVWLKCHVATGVKTNVVTAVRILDKDSNDCPQFVPLVKETARDFVVGEVSADKAYLSQENFEAVAGFGGEAFIPFKTNSTGAKGGLFQKMFHYFQFKQDEYMAHYHKRSNVESTFSMIKRKFGHHLRSKTDVALVNEALCKVLCHNICVLIQEQHELGIETIFWKEPAGAQTIAV